MTTIPRPPCSPAPRSYQSHHASTELTIPCLVVPPPFALTRPNLPDRACRWKSDSVNLVRPLVSLHLNSRQVRLRPYCVMEERANGV